MQTKKELVKEKIKLAATKEFYENGYKDANLREIASNCDITAGNIYRYYESKEALFSDILSPIYDDIERLLMMGPLLLTQASLNVTVNKLILSPILEMAEKNTKELIIMLTSVEGSNFENMSGRIQDMASSVIHKFRPEFDPYFCEVLAYSTVASFVKILKDHVDTPEKIGDACFQMIDYFYLQRNHTEDSK